MNLYSKKVISIVAGTVFVMGMFAVTPFTQAQDDDDADAPLSFEEAMVVVSASADDQEDLQERLGEMNREEIETLTAKICRTRSGAERAGLLSTILKSAVTLQSLEDVNSFSQGIMSVVVNNTSGDSDSARASMGALVGGSYNHPDLEDLSSDEVTDAVAGVAENAAAGAIDAAEQHSDLEPEDVENVAGAVADGGYQSFSEVSDPQDRMEPLADAMVRGGVGAAADSNQERVALAMLRRAQNIADDDLRTRAAGGAAAGGGAAGGQEIADTLQADVPDVEEEAPPTGRGGDEDPVGRGVRENLELPQGAVNTIQPQDRSPR
ncbi:MAG: hypothetical protein ACOCZS_04275 [Verrucomicrobiota bacterium]